MQSDTRVKSPWSYFQELKRLEKDIVFFSEEHVLDYTLNGPQVEYLNTLLENRSVRASVHGDRQVGKTDLIICAILWAIVNKPNVRIFVCSHTHDAVHLIMNSVLKAYEKLDVGMKPYLIEKTKDFLSFEGGTQIRFTAAHGLENRLRGLSNDYVFLDNAEQYINQSKLNLCYPSLIANKSHFACFSTYRPANIILSDMLTGSGLNRKIEIRWYDVPRMIDGRFNMSGWKKKMEIAGLKLDEF